MNKNQRNEQTTTVYSLSWRFAEFCLISLTLQAAAIPSHPSSFHLYPFMQKLTDSRPRDI
jgi:hypothetical protein